MTSVSKGSVFNEIKNSYKPLILILISILSLQVGFATQPEFFETNLVPHFLIILLPLSVSIYSFIVSKLYGGSKVFGLSFFVLGVGFFSTFVAESLYIYSLDILGHDESPLADYFLFAYYPLAITHLIINIRYFAEKISIFQKTTIVLVPIILTVFYTLLVFSNPVDDVSYFYLSLVFVIIATLQLGFVIVGFTLFRTTVLFSTWLLLLLGIFVGTIGDIVYYYVEIIGGDWISNASALWIGSNLIILYALYKHQKAI